MKVDHSVFGCNEFPPLADLRTSAQGLLATDSKVSCRHFNWSYGLVSPRNFLASPLQNSS